MRHMIALRDCGAVESICAKPTDQLEASTEMPVRQNLNTYLAMGGRIA
ncbi:MAG: hypothetical protein HEP70_05135 [Rhodobiaceae bacterium]|nr:hypothetical protein [Rhodobiaceae bacterium]